MPSLARSMSKTLKVSSLARSVSKPLKLPSLARSVPKPLKVPSLSRSVPKPLKVPSLARSVPKPLKRGRRWRAPSGTMLCATSLFQSSLPTSYSPSKNISQHKLKIQLIF